MGDKIIAGIELGGTKTIALIASGTKIIDEFRIPSKEPDAVFRETSSWLKVAQKKYPFEAIGIASFGPVALEKSSEKYGFITTTPKPNWSDTNVIGNYSEWFDGPIGFDTDVNGAALAENLWGASLDTDVSVYITIGTGLGGGIIVNGKPIHGFMHPEMGHLKINRKNQLEFKGNCPFHGDCIEGLVSGPAIAARAGNISANQIPHDDVIWEYVTDEIAEFLTGLFLTLSPQKIAIGGGVMASNGWLFPIIRKKILAKLCNYIGGVDYSLLENLIIAPKLGDKAGPLGAIALGLLALKSQ